MIAKKVALALTAAALAFGALAGCSGADAAGGPNQGFVSGDGTAQVVPADQRKPAPALEAKTFDGEDFSLAAQKGKVVAINVWGSWCAPCRTEAPGMAEVAKELEPKGVTFVGLNTKDQLPGAEAFVRRFEIPYANIYDPDAKLQLAFHDTLPPTSIPATLIIDKEGRVAARILGPAERAVLRNMLDQLAKEPAAS